MLRNVLRIVRLRHERRAVLWLKPDLAPHFQHLIYVARRESTQLFRICHQVLRILQRFKLILRIHPIAVHAFRTPALSKALTLLDGVLEFVEGCGLTAARYVDVLIDIRQTIV